MAEIDDDTDTALPPSKSQRKRDAHAAQKLGQRLVTMREQELRDLPLNDILREALAEARRLTSRAALSRQHQYIGKLMRDADVNAIEAALATREDAHKARARLRP
ncbi:MAG TPA: ribosome biogenesis factor YjgA [Steroidobacteraceae bacterium]|nr:ribosome biogenesis factor YjgA [Steroidobacteraceae bacterium]